jgi:hypothetical protein
MMRKVVERLSRTQAGLDPTSIGPVPGQTWLEWQHDAHVIYHTIPELGPNLIRTRSGSGQVRP